MRSRLVLITVAIAVLLPLSVFATPVTGELDFNGDVTATLTSLNFLCDAPGGPSCTSGEGSFTISPISTGTFAGLSTSSAASFGNILSINNSSTPPGGTVSLANFLTFGALPGVSFTLTQLNVGTGGTCPPAAGATCTPADPSLVSPSDPTGKTGTVFEDTSQGASAEFSVNAEAIGTAGEMTPYTGEFSANFEGMTTSQVLAELAGGGSVTVGYVGKFTPVSTTTVPEPGTASLAVLGLLLVMAGVGVRRFSHC